MVWWILSDSQLWLIVTSHHTWNARNYTSFFTTVLFTWCPVTQSTRNSGLTANWCHRVQGAQLFFLSLPTLSWQTKLNSLCERMLCSHHSYTCSSLSRQMKKGCFQVKIEEINTILSLHSFMHGVCVTVILWFSQHATQDLQLTFSPTVTHGMLTLCSYS